MRVVHHVVKAYAIGASAKDVYTRSAASSSFRSFIYEWGGDPLALLPPSGSVSFEKVVVEVGLSVQASYWKQLQEDESMMLIGIEPNRVDGLLHPTHPRLWLLPVAVDQVSYTSGEPPLRKVFYRTESGSCSSFLQPKRANLSLFPSLERCLTVAEELLVPVVPLAPILERAASFASSGTIHILDIDVQGADIRVMESGGAALSKVKRALLETFDLSDDPVNHEQIELYHGVPSLSEVLIRMEKLGFAKERCWPESIWFGNDYIRSRDCVFASPAEFVDVSEDCFNDEMVQAVNNFVRVIHLQATGALASVGFFDARKLAAYVCVDMDRDDIGFWDYQSGITPERCCISEYLKRTGISDHDCWDVSRFWPHPEVVVS